MYQQSMSVKRQLCSCDSSVTLLTVSYAWKYCSEWVTVRLGAYLPSANMLRQPVHVIRLSACVVSVPLVSGSSSSPLSCVTLLW
jgi:hypothetical protein